LILDQVIVVTSLQWRFRNWQLSHSNLATSWSNHKK